MQTFVIWFIDGSSYIDVDDPKWRFYMLYADPKWRLLMFVVGMCFSNSKYLPWAAVVFRTVFGYYSIAVTKWLAC
jgi:hypothetical protein